VEPLNVTAFRHLVIGTAGHIDHGKTTLVEKLTGTHTHHLPEERRRGITIDLGFASCQLEEFSFAVVDVPGHQRFVRHMVAGATGIDIALLVVAADDSVMPQTREHLEIMDLLGIQSGVIVLTKTDLVDREFVDFAEEEVRDLVKSTFLSTAQILRTSAVTGTGIESVEAAILGAARRHQDRQSLWPLFRMPVDRAFSMQGHGTVVTGSVLSGEVAQGDQLEILPQQQSARVRSVQRHRQEISHAEAQQRTAINLAGVKLEDVSRGFELATPGWLLPSTRLLVEIRNLASSGITLRNRSTLTLHVGTSETRARLILQSDDLLPGDSGYGELRLGRPVVTTFGQRFLLRRISPAGTVGGGRVIDPMIPHRKRLRDHLLIGRQAASPDPVQRVAGILARERGPLASDLRHLAVRSGCTLNQLQDAIQQLRKLGTLQSITTYEPPVLMHQQQIQRLQQSVLRLARQEISRRTPRRSISVKAIHECCRELADSKLTDWLIAGLIKLQLLLPLGSQFTLPGTDLQITKHQRLCMNRLLELVQQAGMTPPSLKELAEYVTETPRQTAVLLDLAVEEGQAVRADSDFYFSNTAVQQARSSCIRLLLAEGSATVARLRDHWAVSRKHALPLIAYFDSCGLTRREGDLRLLADHGACQQKPREND
jgi:selenocysteine-specific elongation factor